MQAGTALASWDRGRFARSLPVASFITALLLHEGPSYTAGLGAGAINLLVEDPWRARKDMYSIIECCFVTLCSIQGPSYTTVLGAGGSIHADPGLGEGKERDP